ncbi:MAG TPA: hypothetical protein VMY37_16570 [Thermoguttaceae bacterium]|nr:hypothetical protein [Thermoguttaceae bacterium]
MNRIADEQKRRNEQSRGMWDRFGPHRDRVTRLLVDSATAGGRLCVLGAGNCNDVDLGALLDEFREIHLVDLDTDALRSGVSRQGYEDSARVFLHGDVDVTCIADRLGSWTPEHPPESRELDACLELAATHPPLDLAGPFDTVCSACLLTQLLDSIVMALGQRHPRCLELALRVRAQHLRLLVELLRPGGTGVLVMEIVSSATFPDLPKIPESRLVETATRLINERNFFTGMNPLVIHASFHSDPQLAPWVETAEITSPWLWDLGPRVYLVCAVVVRRKLGES